LALRTPYIFVKNRPFPANFEQIEQIVIFRRIIIDYAKLDEILIITSCAEGRHNMPPPLQVDLWPFDLESGVRVTCDVAYLCANFSLPRPLCSRLRPDVRGRQTYDRRQTSNRRQTRM